MGQAERALQRFLSGEADRDIRITDLDAILMRLGFHEQARGSHRVYRHPCGAKIVLATHQPQVPAYQVREVRRILGAYGLTQTHDA